MQNILFLVHRIPYPPNKGDKIRSYHFLKALSGHFNVYLGTFIDDEEDWQYRDNLNGHCREMLCLSLSPRMAKIRSLSGLVRGDALSLPYYANTDMQDWIERTISANAIEKVVLYSSVMGQFVIGKANLQIYADFVDVDSDKWRQYAEKKRWPESWVYRRESAKLLEFERGLAKRATVSTFVSQQEADLFKQLAPESASKIEAINNGVDSEYFSRQTDGTNPYQEAEKIIVFTGAMDYWANVDAVVWFAKQVLPRIVAQVPHAKFYIVGSKPTKEVLTLAEDRSVVVTGRVEDIRPYLAHATIAVAPLRIARGIQNKVLEAMAMEKRVLATSAAMEGISEYPAGEVIVGDEVDVMAEQACRLLSLSSEQLVSQANRTFVETQFSWRSSGEKLVRLIGS